MFEMKVTTDNAAFESEGELPRILRHIARRVDGGDDSGIVFDVNGNRVGYFAGGQPPCAEENNDDA